MLALLLAVAVIGSSGHSALASGSGGAPSLTTPTPGGAGLDVTWFGQSCFLIRTPAGTSILTDPVPPRIGFHPPVVKADLVTVSHTHPDHTNLKMVEVTGAAAGGAEVVRGLKASGDWAEVDESVADIHLYTVHAFHDPGQGGSYGKNAVFVFEIAGGPGRRWRVAHLGDLGTELDPAQMAAIGPLDVLMVPVGGFNTLDAAGARRVVAALAPRYAVFPMHYRAPGSLIRELTPVDAFAGPGALRLDSPRYTVPVGPPPPKPVIVVLKAE